MSADPLAFLHPAARAWFEACFDAPTRAQTEGWPSIERGESTLLLAPTGSGKTLAAFLSAINRLSFAPAPPKETRCRVLYISPLKALGVDVERNLRAPLAGIAAVAQRRGEDCRTLEVGVRSGDTPQRERARLLRRPPDILITTPESLYLMLTSQMVEALRSVDTVIVDEIHTMVAGKRGAHLFLSLERLEALRGADRPLQRIGLSATQRPLEEVARLLGGATVRDGRPRPRPVTIVDAGHRRPLDLTVEVPVEDMAALAAPTNAPGPLEGGAPQPSIWPSIHPRLVELVRAHRSTLIFVNSRRLAERLATAINEVAGEELALAHHGSIAKDTRATIEDRLKRGLLPALVATSSLELGIDMGAIDLVVQLEAPPSVASGLQRVGRANHDVGGVSRGVMVPKYRGDLLAAAAASEAMLDGRVESTRYPRNPLDVLAQQVVAIVATASITADALYDLVRGAANFADLPRASFDGVLDMLTGRYPSDDFAELRPRLTWDRVSGQLTPRRGAKRVAIINGGTIPDRGLYGVFLADAQGAASKRVGELDEEMVFESRVGDVFLLGASSWRIEEITHDRVMVTPAPGEPGRMPFWHGDRPGRPLPFGEAIGALSRTLTEQPEASALATLRDAHKLDERAARNLMAYLSEQREATRVVPSDRTLVVERFLDEIGDWRVCVLSPFGARVHAPWATAVMARLLEAHHVEIDVMWSDDGIVFRIPEGELDPWSFPAESGPSGVPGGAARPRREAEGILEVSRAPRNAGIGVPNGAPRSGGFGGEAPSVELFFPAPEELEDRIVRRLADTSLFAARFRENAGRALLLTRRRPGQRSPLWAQRRKAASLLSVAAQYRDFPIVLETYRECLQDVFDLPGLTDLMHRVRRREVRVVEVESKRPSPFAQALLFNYVAQFMYEGDAPLAERRAQALTIDFAQLKELLGEAALRELLDLEAIAEVVQQIQRRGYPLRHADAVHDLLLTLGDQSAAQLAERCEDPAELERWLTDLRAARRVVRVKMGPRAERVHGAGERDALPHESRTDRGADLRADRRVVPVKMGPGQQGGDRGGERYIAAEDAGRYRDALGVVSPPGLPEAFLERVDDALGDLVARHARTHGPFTALDLARRFGLGAAPIEAALRRLAARDKVVEGEFLPGGHGQEWCDTDVLRRIKRKSLAKLRQEVEPVEPPALARFLIDWHRLDRPGHGLDAVLDVVEQLQGVGVPASVLEREVLPARVEDYAPGDLDRLCAAGEIIWRGVGSLGGTDGRLALYLADAFPALAPPPDAVDDAQAQRVMQALADRGASFFDDLVRAVDGFAPDVLEALWTLVWAGRVTNDTLVPVRGRLGGGGPARRGRRPRGPGPGFRSRRRGAPGSEGRWTLLPDPEADGPGATARRTALTRQLLERHGVLTREGVASEGIAGGFSAVYPVLKAMEEAGQVRRGYFVAGLGATQFALPGADDRLRFSREPSEAQRSARLLAATDPANPYGAALPWPESAAGRPERAAGARVVLLHGALIGFVTRGGKGLLTFLPDDAADHAHAAKALAEALAAADLHRRPVIETIDGERAGQSPLRAALEAAGFRHSYDGLVLPRGR